MSNYLDGIITKQHGSTNASVVFLDVVKYSKRKSIIQQKILDSFNKVLSEAIEFVSAKHVSDSQKQNLNLSSDIIKIPTGDGAAIVFPFQGLQNIQLDFALNFLQSCLAIRNDVSCELFNENGWCNCHDFFDVRIGAADGKIIVFRDVNGNYNVAGNAINMANRVMGLADQQQVIFTNDSFKNMIDMTEDTALENRFTCHGKISVKHDLEIEVCQYTGFGENFLNKNVPLEIEISRRQLKLRTDHPMFGDAKPKSPADQLKVLEIAEILKEMPIPAGFKGMFNTDIADLNPEKVKAIVEAFKAVDKLTGMSGTIIDLPMRDS
jgi:hypothetical protein